MTTLKKTTEGSSQADVSDKYKTMIVTPEGSIIRIGGPELKPEADPGWEERKAERKAKKAHLVSRLSRVDVVAAQLARRV